MAYNCRKSYSGYHGFIIKIIGGLNMNINWKSRLRNKTFWVALASAIVVLTQQLGLSIFPQNWADIMNTMLTILAILGIIIDPTTDGIKDGEV